MCRSRWLASLSAAGILLFLCGCPGGLHKHTYPEDPLFLSKKPLEVTPAQASPSTAAYAEPQIPPVPVLVRLAAKQHQ